MNQKRAKLIRRQIKEKIDKPTPQIFRKGKAAYKKRVRRGG